jgi:hypothetical protein
MIQQHPSECGAFGADVASVLQSVVATIIQQQPSAFWAVAAAPVQSVVARITQQQLSDLAAPGAAASVVQSVVATMIQQQLADGGSGARICSALPPLRKDPPLDISLSLVCGEMPAICRSGGPQLLMLDDVPHGRRAAWFKGFECRPPATDGRT